MNLQIVSVQPASKGPGILWRKQGVAERLARAEHLSLNEVHVQVAVVVVVEQRHARAENLGHVESARHAVEMPEVETRVVGTVREPFSVGCRLRSLRSVG